MKNSQINYKWYLTWLYGLDEPTYDYVEDLMNEFIQTGKRLARISNILCPIIGNTNWESIKFHLQKIQQNEDLLCSTI